MAQINVTQLAQQLGLPTALLIEQLQAAGVARALTEDSPLTEKDKTQLLEHLRKAHGAGEAKQKITLMRRQTTEIKKSDSMGKSRTIHIEVRKKRVLVKREAEPEAAPGPVRPVLDAEQIALREAEARQQAELAARQAVDAERKRRRKEAEAVAEVKAPEETKAAGPTAPASVEGTLHKPTVKPEEKAQKAEKKAKKQVKEVVWKDDTVKRRSIKTRGDATGGLGWRARKARHGHATAHAEESEGQRTFAAPTEPVELRYRDATRMGKLYLLPAGVDRRVAGWAEQGPDIDDQDLTRQEWRARMARHAGDAAGEGSGGPAAVNTKGWDNFMEQRPNALRVAAVVSSVVIAGVWLLSRGGVSLLPGSKSARTVQFGNEAMVAADTPATQPSARP